MNGERIVVDTSALVDYAKGVASVAPHIEGYEVHISIITEIEFLAWPGLDETRVAEARAFLHEYSSNDIGDFVRDYSAWIKRTYKLKLPDAVIAATAKHLNAPLITRDQGFRKVTHLIQVRFV
jgi:predicted nucleic acid-binding protein